MIDPIREQSERMINADFRFAVTIAKTLKGICDTADYLICAGSRLFPVAGWKYEETGISYTRAGLPLFNQPKRTLWGEEAKRRHLEDLEAGRKSFLCA